MKTIRTLQLALVCLAAFNIPLATCFAQGTAFTYQGQLNDGANPASGTYDLQFTIYDAPSGGSVVGPTFPSDGTTVINGLFTVMLDFGSDVFDGNACWLEIAVRTNGIGAFTMLAPRQRLTATPYALYAPNSGAAVTAASADSVAAAAITGTIPLSQLPGSVLTNNASNVTLAGSFSGDGSALAHVPGTIPWQTIAGTAQTASPNQGYLLTNESLTTLTLPGSANVGDVVIVSGMGSSEWQVLAASGQIIVGHTDSAGQIWSPRPNAGNRLWTSIAGSADGIRLVAVAHDDQIYTSTDAGETWTSRSAGNRQWNSVACSADGTKILAAAWEGQLYTSTDSGATWTMRQSEQNWSSVASSADGSKVVATVSGGQIYTSSDAGVTWTARESNRQWQAVASSADGNKLVAVVGRTVIGSIVLDGQIYTSTDSGATWTARESNRNWQAVACSADGSKLVAVVYGGRIYTSTDSGMTWVARESNRNWQAVASSADGATLVAVVWNGRIYTSTDSGVSWTPRENPRQWSFVSSSADGSKLVAALFDGPIYASGLTPLPLSGTGNESLRLQYIGQGEWQPLMESRVAHLDASKITSGILAADRVPDLDASKLVSGTLAPGRIPDLDASKVVSGTLADARLSANVAFLDAPQTFTADNYFANRVGIGHQLTVQNPSDASFSTAIYGVSSSTAGAGQNRYGVYGETLSSDTSGSGGGIMGRASSATGATAGVRGESASANGTGVFAFATSSSGNNSALRAVCNSAAGWAGHFTGRGYFSGNLGLGTATPGFPLSFPNTIGDKISLWGQSGAHYGFGVQGALLQIHSDTSSSDIAFGYGTSASFTETMRIKGDGRVGIGTSAPAAKLQVVGNSRVDGDLHVTGDLRVDGRTKNPAAMGSIHFNGTVKAATPNVTSFWNPTSERYEITIAGENLGNPLYIVSVTASSIPPRTATFDIQSGKLMVYIHYYDGTRAQSHFDFVVHKL